MLGVPSVPVSAARQQAVLASGVQHCLGHRGTAVTYPTTRQRPARVTLLIFYRRRLGQSPRA